MGFSVSPAEGDGLETTILSIDADGSYLIRFAIDCGTPLGAGTDVAGLRPTL